MTVKLKLLVFVMFMFVISCEESEPTFGLKPLKYPELKLMGSDSTHYVEIGRDHYSDNHIYNNCREVTYEYEYLKNGEKKYFTILGIKEWEFVSADSLEEKSAIKEIKLSSKNPDPKHDYSPQSTIRYQYIKSNGESEYDEHTAVVENSRNIIIHNPRGGFFRHLFIFPWPSIKFPINIGEEWEWGRKYNGDTFGDRRFTELEGIIDMSHQYKVLGEETLKLKFGKIQCYKIAAMGVNEKEGIENRLTYYFNPQIGFVQFEYQTNDGAVVNLLATEIKNNCKE